MHPTVTGATRCATCMPVNPSILRNRGYHRRRTSLSTLQTKLSIRLKDLWRRIVTLCLMNKSNCSKPALYVGHYSQSHFCVFSFTVIYCQENSAHIEHILTTFEQSIIRTGADVYFVLVLASCDDRNDLYCVEWGVKLYSNQPSQLYACCHVSFLVHFQVLMSYVIFTGRLLMVMPVQLSCISCMYIMYICVCVCVWLQYELVAELFQDLTQAVTSPSRRSAGSVPVRPAKEVPKSSSQQKQSRKTVGSQASKVIIVIHGWIALKSASKRLLLY